MPNPFDKYSFLDDPLKEQQIAQMYPNVSPEEMLMLQERAYNQKMGQQNEQSKKKLNELYLQNLKPESNPLSKPQESTLDKYSFLDDEEKFKFDPLSISAPPTPTMDREAMLSELKSNLMKRMADRPTNLEFQDKLLAAQESAKPGLGAAALMGLGEVFGGMAGRPSQMGNFMKFADMKKKQALAPLEMEKAQRKEDDALFMNFDKMDREEKLAALKQRLAAQKDKQSEDWRQKNYEQRERGIQATQKEREMKRADAEKPKKLTQLSAEGKKRYDSIRMGYEAVEDMDKALKEGENTFSLVGDNKFTIGARNWSEAIGRLQSGGAINSEEEKRFRAMAPTVWDSAEIQKLKIKKMKEEMEKRLKTFGFSPKELGLEKGSSSLPVGTVRSGYRFKGGNPNDKASWEKI